MLDDLEKYRTLYQFIKEITGHDATAFAKLLGQNLNTFKGQVNRRYMRFTDVIRMKQIINEEKKVKYKDVNITYDMLEPFFDKEDKLNLTTKET